MPVESLFNLLRSRPGRRPCRVPKGRRVYAIGDVHGRLDLLDSMAALIERDERERGACSTLVIFLGDLIDRGPDSCGVVARAMELRAGPRETRFLLGNHEEVFLKALTGDLRALRLLLRIGGKETILSYGVSAEEYRRVDFEELIALLRAKVPDSHIDFLSSFEPAIEVGDYLFVHAGVRPGVDLAEQSHSDMRWIRDDFLRHRDDHGKMVVHGHNISSEADVRANRIGIDTGAFASGRLTALGLEADARWFLST